MELPAKVSKYELQEFLGGGMSHVYRAQDTVLGRTVALKMLTEAGCQDAETKARFLQEARMAGNIAHDNVISVFDFGEDEGRPFIVMEFLRGESLRDAIKHQRTGDLRNQLHIALQIARAVGYIHTRKIIHRDVKPENIHLDASGRVKLMDFGIAKTENVQLTRVGFTLGTPYYMAPEQVLGQQITPQVDVYAFGVVLFELLCGVKPIKGETVERVFTEILHEPFDLTPVKEKGVPHPVFDLIERCTAKDPAQRPQGFEPVVAELEKLLEEMTAKVAVPAQPRPWTPPPAPVYAVPPPAPEQLPAFMQKLPPKFQTQEYFIAIVAVGVLGGMLLLYFLLRSLFRLIF